MVTREMIGFDTSFEVLKTKRDCCWFGWSLVEKCLKVLAQAPEKLPIAKNP